MALGSWEQEGSRVLHEMVRLADSVERVATAVHGLQTDLTVMRSRRLSGVAAQVIASLIVAAIIGLASAGFVLWRDMDRLQRDNAEIRSRMDHIHGRYGRPAKPAPEDAP